MRQCPWSQAAIWDGWACSAHQSGLHKALEHLPWAQIPSMRVITCDHGRRVHHRIKIASRPAWITFPGAELVIQVHRRRSCRGRTGTTMNHSETIYLICCLPSDQAHPEQILAWLQGHWDIETLHWIRDVVFNEDHHQLRTGNAPQVMATLPHHTRHPEKATKLLAKPT